MLMQPTNEQLTQFQSDLEDVITLTIEQLHTRIQETGPLSSDDAIRFVADITALTIFELAERLDGNADKTGALSYRFAAAEGEEMRLPAEVLSAITGWLSAPKDRNPLAGKTSHPYPFDFYGAKDYA